MYVSSKNQTKLYAAIHHPVSNLRISVRQSVEALGDQNVKDLDTLLYKLNEDIWKNVKEILDLNTLY